MQFFSVYQSPPWLNSHCCAKAKWKTFSENILGKISNSPQTLSPIPYPWKEVDVYDGSLSCFAWTHDPTPIYTRYYTLASRSTMSPSNGHWDKDQEKNMTCVIPYLWLAKSALVLNTLEKVAQLGTWNLHKQCGIATYWCSSPQTHWSKRQSFLSHFKRPKSDNFTFWGEKRHSRRVIALNWAAVFTFLYTRFVCHEKKCWCLEASFHLFMWNNVFIFPLSCLICLPNPTHTHCPASQNF